MSAATFARRSVRYAGKSFRRWRTRRRHYEIFREFREFTMIHPKRYADNLALAETVRDVHGSVVECGVWKGGMIAGIAKVMGNERAYYLFDSFEGLPPAREIDGAAAIAWQGNTTGPGYYDNCSASRDWAERAMLKSGVDRYQLIPGWFEKTLPAFDPAERIALLRLDGDWYESTMTCLNFLFDRVETGGLIILDDYYYWDGCSRALHDFLSRRSAVERIQSIGDTCFLKKV